jgi:hypothetical protein
MAGAPGPGPPPAPSIATVRLVKRNAPIRVAGSRGPEYSSFTTHPAFIEAGVFLKCLTLHPGLYSCPQPREVAVSRPARERER